MPRKLDTRKPKVSRASTRTLARWTFAGSSSDEPMLRVSLSATCSPRLASRHVAPVAIRVHPRLHPCAALQPTRHVKLSDLVPDDEPTGLLLKIVLMTAGMVFPLTFVHATSQGHIPARPAHRQLLLDAAHRGQRMVQCAPAIHGVKGVPWIYGRQVLGRWAFGADRWPRSAPSCGRIRPRAN